MFGAHQHIPGSTIARVLRCALAPLALAVALTGAPARADVLPGLVIDGQMVVAPGQPTERRGDTWFVPTRPIAEALGAVVVFEPRTRSVSVSIPSQGTTAYYDGVTGEITRDFAPTERMVPGLPLGTGESDLRLPTDLVAALFSVSIRVDILSDAVIVVSNPLDPEKLRTEMPAIGVQEVRYRGSLLETGQSVSGSLTLENRTRVRKGLLSTRLDGRYTESQLAHVNTFLTQLDTGNGRRFMFGDLRGDPQMAWLRTHGRGVGAEIELAGGSRRLAASYVQVSAGSSEEGRNFLGPRFDEHAAMLSHGWRLRDEPLAEDALDVGALWIGRGMERREGLLVGLRHQTRRERFLTRAEAGWFLSPDDNLSRRQAIELNAQWTPRSHTQLLARAGHFGTEFQRAATFAEDRSSFYTLGASRRLSSEISLGGSHSLHYAPSLRTTDRTYTSTVGWSPSSPVLQSAVTTLSVVDPSHSDTRTDLSLDLRGRVSIGRWHWALRRRLGSGHAIFSSLGLLSDTPVGRTQLTASWSQDRFAGASIDWTPPLRRVAAVSMTVGARWSRTSIDEQRDFTAHVRIGYDGGNHSANVSLDQQQVGHLTRADWRGRFVFDEGRIVRSEEGGAIAYDQPVSIEGRVYIDTNLNGRFDEGERPLKGVGVTLDRGMDRRKTDADGMYAFEGLPPGTHNIALDLRTLRADLSLLGGTVGDVTLEPLTSARMDFRTCVNRRITGVVFVDLNANERRDRDEPVVADALVFITGGSNTLTDPDGTFRLGDVPPGLHALQIAPGSLDRYLAPPSALQITVPSDRDVHELQIGVIPLPRPMIRKQF